MLFFFQRLAGLLLLGLAAASSCAAAPPSTLPSIEHSEQGGRLLVDGRPYLILGGELGNSSAGTAAQADAILPRLAALHVNTVLMPVPWEEIEATEGHFDFSLLDHWRTVAEANQLHLVLLWFGAWKNAFSEYTPTWVKNDPRRFPRALGANGQPLEILSTFGGDTLHCDQRAFGALMQHLRQADTTHTVLMVQVENEVGVLGPGGRDRSPAANQAFGGAVPRSLVQWLVSHRDTLEPELAADFHPAGHSWTEVFGHTADERFMAWRYATYIEAVVEAGKHEYALPMYTNAQLPAPAERPGEYPSGAPYPGNLDIFRAMASSVDFFSPDIYWPDFSYWIGRYAFPGNPVFIPEARLDAAPGNALYALGAAHAFGFSPFDIDSLEPAAGGRDPGPQLMQTYAVLEQMQDLLLPAQAAGRTAGLVLHATSPRPAQTVALGGFLMTASLSRTWPARTLATDDGAMLVLATGTPGEFYIAGSGLNIAFARDPDVDNRLAGIASIEEGSLRQGEWTTARRLNGDQSDQGRQLLMEAHRIALYRVRLYTADARP